MIFPHLRTLWVQLSTHPSLVESSVTDGLKEATEAVVEVGKTCRKEMRVFLLGPAVGTDARLSVDLEAGWREIVTGGDGFWTGGSDVTDRKVE